MFRSVFRRLETDHELRMRVIAKAGNNPLVWCGGTSLDDAAWLLARIQRRIVEDAS